MFGFWGLFIQIVNFVHKHIVMVKGVWAWLNLKDIVFVGNSGRCTYTHCSGKGLDKLFLQTVVFVLYIQCVHTHTLLS